jgi:hypothetical protein
MSDFDERLSLALRTGAADAPEAHALAAGARHRLRARRQKYAVAGTAAVAVLAIALPTALIASNGDSGSEVGGDPTTTITDVDGEWQTVGRDGAEMDLPANWRQEECEFAGVVSIPRYGPQGGDPCDMGGTSAAFYGSATFDASELPGVVQRGDGEWSGYVTAGDDWVVWAATPDQDVTLRILASARAEGEAVVAATAWERGRDQGLVWEIPAGWGVGAGAGAPYGVEVGDRPAGERVKRSLPERVGDGAVRMYGHIGSQRVTVTAPTRAVAELVLSSVTSA